MLTMSRVKRYISRRMYYNKFMSYDLSKPVRTTMGFSIYLTRNPVFSLTVYATGNYDEEEGRALIGCTEKGDVFADIGAYCGWYSLLISKNTPASKIYSFEPTPESYAIIRKNIRLNHCKNIFPKNIALSDKTGIQKFYTSKTHSGRNALTNFDSDVQDGYRMVRTATFDSLKLGRIDIMKLDVQGVELNVLKGMVRTLERHAPHHIILEYSRGHLASNGTKPEEVLDFLEEYGYLIKKVFDAPRNAGREWLLKSDKVLNIFYERGG